MADDKWADVTVAVGQWKYDGTVDQAVRVVGLSFDYFYSLAEADGQLEPGEKPEPMGPDGLLYYVVFAHVDSPGFPTVLQAKGYAQSKVQSEVRWP